MTELNIYLDYNAAAPLRQVAYDKMTEILKNYAGNASSVHHTGRRLSAILEQSRHQIAQTLGTQASNVIFTSTGSEANNYVVRGFKSLGYRILVCATDHVSTLAASTQVEIIPVDHQGILNLDALDYLLQHNPEAQPTLVSVHLANNESGIIQPLEQIVQCVRRYGSKIHTDAIQAVGRYPVNFKNLGVDAMTVASGKIGGPFGAAALILADKITLPSLIRGGGQEKGRRAGTHNVPAIAGFNVALQEACKEDWSSVQHLRDHFEQIIIQQVFDVKIYGQHVPRLPNTSLIRMPGVSTEVQLMSLDLAVLMNDQKINFAVSAGSACSSGKTIASTVLKAMGVSDRAARESLRISLCPTTTSQHMNLFTQRWLDIFHYHQQRKAA
ncbi:MAG: cysteine desulfurase family protein [Janthinobacterium lividum]